MTSQDTTTTRSARVPVAAARVRGAMARGASSVARTVTGAGWCVIAIATLALILGPVLGWRELTAAGAAAALALAAAAAFLIGRPRYDVALQVERNRTAIDQPVPASVRLRSRSRWALWSPHLEVRVGQESVQLPPPGRQTGVSHFAVPAVARGVVQVGPVRSVRADPLGLFRRTAEWSQREEVHVHPETVGLPPTSTGFVRDLEGSPTRDLTSDDISFHALREYRPGDDRRHVYWKAAARTGELMVRQFEETRRSHIVIAFGTDTSSWESPEEFELGVSAASSLALRAIHDGRDVTVVTTPATRAPGAPPAREPQFLPAVTPQRLLDGASEVRYGTGDAAVGELAELAAACIPGISIVFLVVGTRPGMRELRRWSDRFPAGVQTLAVVCGPGQVPGLSEIAGLSVTRIGFLDDLRVAMMRGSSV